MVVNNVEVPMNERGEMTKQLKVKTLGELPTILEGSMEYTLT